MCRVEGKCGNGKRCGLVRGEEGVEGRGWGKSRCLDGMIEEGGRPLHRKAGEERCKADGAGRWDEGLLDMCIGDKRKLTIPPEFGYGQRAMGAIPAGSTLSESFPSFAWLVGWR